MYFFRLQSHALLSILALALLLAGGCKKDESPTTPPPQGNAPTITSFTANPLSVPAGGDSVLLSWNVTGATAVSIAPSVGAVTPTDAGSRKVFVATSTTFILTASNTYGSVTANAPVTAALPITVSGFVKDADGEPLSGVSVIIKGKTPSVTSVNGAFSISSVVPPYEITLILSTFQTAVVYQGLTRSNPVLLYPLSTTILKSATISGSVPAASGKTTRVFFISGTKSWGAIADPTTGAYFINARWRGSDNSFVGKLHVLRSIPNSNGLPAQYDAYTSRDLTISAGGSFSGNNFVAGDLTDIAEKSISGSISGSAPGYTVGLKQLYLKFANAFLFLAQETGAATDFSYTVPDIPTGATFEVDAYAQVSAYPNNRESYYWKMGIVGGTSNISIYVWHAPQLNLPAHSGTGIDVTTQFLWAQGGATGAYLAYIRPYGGASGPTFYVFTFSNSTSIPNLSAQGLGLPPSTVYTWTTTEYFGLPSIDDVASETFIPLIRGNAGEIGVGTSETFSFTTHP